MAYLDSAEELDPDRAEWEIDLYFFQLDTSVVPGGVLAAGLIALFIFYFPPGNMLDLAVSSEAIREGRIATFLTHMVAHGGFAHLWLNVLALFALSRTLVRGFGLGVRGLLTYAGLLILSGLAGALVFLAINPFGTVPMLGASGAICGLLGFSERFDPESRALVPLGSVRIHQALIHFAKWNLILFLALYFLVWAFGGAGGLAWEAHLGGFAVGLLGAPLFVRLAMCGVQTEATLPAKVVQSGHTLSP